MQQAKATYALRTIEKKSKQRICCANGSFYLPSFAPQMWKGLDTPHSK